MFNTDQIHHLGTAIKLYCNRIFYRKKEKRIIFQFLYSTIFLPSLYSYLIKDMRSDFLLNFFIHLSTTTHIVPDDWNMSQRLRKSFFPYLIFFYIYCEPKFFGQLCGHPYTFLYVYPSYKIYVLIFEIEIFDVLIIIKKFMWFRMRNWIWRGARPKKNKLFCLNFLPYNFW
jgi:hypothetical protein